MTEKKGTYQRLKDAGLIGFMKTECHIYGCNDLETTCKDCGRLVNTAHYDNEWIDIQVKNPPQKLRVLVARFDSRKNVKMYFIGIATKYGNDWTWGDEEEIMDYKYGRITHWMPLPIPPKETNELSSI